MDRVPAEVRSRIMRAIRSEGTGPERKVEGILRSLGVEFVAHARLAGRPDFLLVREGVALFVDGCFWHGCPRHSSPPEGWWAEKIGRNRRRDRRDRRALRALGLRVLVLWEHDLDKRRGQRAQNRLTNVLLRG